MQIRPNAGLIGVYLIGLLLVVLAACSSPSQDEPEAGLETAGADLEVKVYSEVDFKQEAKLKVGEYNAPFGKKVGNNAISSLKVGKGVTVIACAEVAAGGACKTFKAGEEVTNLSAIGFDNVISYLRVEEQVSPESLRSLGSLKVPKHKLFDLVADEEAVVALGKAFFWDMAVGSDGQSCGSCHFNAGADNRIKNQLSPGINAGDDSFDRTASGAAGGPNYTLTEKDFPFHAFNDANDHDSGVRFSSNDVVSSQGVFNSEFVGVPSTSLLDVCDRFPDPVFHVGHKGTRRVAPRNTPTVINTVFNFRNFWDGRASNNFNGVSIGGSRDRAAVILEKGKPKQLSLDNASLASQAAGPPFSDREVSCKARAFVNLAQKLLPRRPLAVQRVHPQDSALGAYRAEGGVGLDTTYEALIQTAFKDKYWQAKNPNSGLRPVEANFALFWGISLQLYQATLISDDAPFDTWVEGRGGSLGGDAEQGLDIFLGKGKCINCHTGPEFSGAASDLQQANKEKSLIGRMRMGDGGVALYDNGFYNIGVTPTHDDLGLGGSDAFGNPLSYSRQYLTGNFVDRLKGIDPCTFEVPFSDKCKEEPADLRQQRAAVDGAFRVPSLRNVELTGPYFHNGSAATLEQVVQFYNRGGNFRNPELAPDIQPLGLSDAEQAVLVAFLKTLTDERVRYEQAPFDHPQLFIPNGHPGDQHNTQGGAFGQADMAVTEWLEVPAVGKDGRSPEGLAPLRTFEWVLKRGEPDLERVAPPPLGE